MSAIGGTGHSAVYNTLEFAGDWPLYRTCLLATALRVRQTSGHLGLSPIPDVFVFEYYQNAVEQLGQRLANFDHTTASARDEMLDLMAATNLLVLFGFARGDLTWPIHLDGCQKLLHSLQDNTLLDHPMVSRLRKSAAYLDISAFSIGKATRSSNSWLHLKYLLDSDKASSPLDQHDVPVGGFTSVEAVSGYPESLLTLIATIARFVDEQVEGASSLAATPQYEAALHARASELEHQVQTWRPPTIPAYIPAPAALCLASAWEAFRKAALMFLWRGRGFRADLTVPVQSPPAAADHMAGFVAEILQLISGFIRAVESDDQIRIANAMLWPFTIAASEVSLDPRLQQCALQILDGLQVEFGLGQVKHLKTVLPILWRQVAQSSPGSGVSLESVARSLHLCIPVY